MMITEKKWVLGKEESDQEDAVKNLRIIWEGLFFGRLIHRLYKFNRFLAL
jgi:hypothetical protein